MGPLLGVRSARIQPAAVAALVALTMAVPAAAQIDYRNLDDDRPTLIEDAYPVERLAFEFLAPWRFSRNGTGNVHAFVPEIEYGVFPNFQFGLKLSVAGAASADADREWGLSGLRLFGLYNFNTESAWLPALSLRTDLSLPVGSLAGEGTRATVKGIATRSWGRSRVHLNGAYTIGRDGDRAVAEVASKWWAGAAVDRTLFRRSTLVVAEIYARREETAAPLETNASLGFRYQWSPYTVVDAGVTRRLRAAGPDLEITIGISRAFAIAGLFPAGRAGK